jgi:hypothetical protein
VFIALLTENKDYITVQVYVRLTFIKYYVPLRKRVKCQDGDKHMWKRQKSSNKTLGKIAYSGTSSFLAFIK